MIAPALKRYAVLAAALSLSSASALAEPPRLDALKMRNAPRNSPALTLWENPSAKEPEPVAWESPSAKEAEPAAPAPAIDPVAIDGNVKEVTAVLELCYELARRSDPSLKPPVAVLATVHADGSIDLRAEGEALGNGYFSRCADRKLASIAPVASLREPSADERLIVLGATPPTR